MAAQWIYLRASGRRAVIGGTWIDGRIDNRIDSPVVARFAPSCVPSSAATHLLRKCCASAARK